MGSRPSEKDKEASLTYEKAAEAKMRAGQFPAAVAFFNMAIDKFSGDARLFRKRSSCHYALEKFSSAISDAEKAINLDSKDITSHILKGKSLVHLLEYKEAEKAFKLGQDIDPSAEECKEGLEQVRRLYLQDLGFSGELVTTLSKFCVSIQDATDAAVEKANAENAKSGLKNDEAKGSDVQPKNETRGQTYKTNTQKNQRGNSRARCPGAYFKNKESRRKSRSRHGDSDTESVSSMRSAFSTMSMRGNLRQEISDIERIRPANIFNFSSIFVYNLDKNVTEDTLREVFAEFGDIRHIAIHKRGGAHINYGDPESPRNAMYKYHMTKVRELTIPGRILKMGFRPSSRYEESRLGTRKWTSNECYFFRTTGCDDSMRTCDKAHHPMCRGIDYRPSLLNNILF